jgi:hypothetical protein
MTSRTVRMRPTTQERKLKEQEVAKREGRYERWIGTRDMPGVGIKTRLTCEKAPLREIHLLSAAERAVFLELWWSDVVKAIFDQWALDREKTKRAAAAADLDHPTYTPDGEPLVLSTDLVAYTEIDGKAGRKAVSVKSKANFEKVGMTPRQRIEQQTWCADGVPFEVAVAHGMHASRSKNLAWLLRAENDMAGRELSAAEVLAQRELLSRLKRRDDRLVMDACEAVDRLLSLESGTASKAFRQLAAKRRISFELNAIAPSRLPVNAIKILRAT